jgi:hypothetical protein
MEFAPQEFLAALAALAAPVLDAAGRAQPGWLLLALVVHSASILCRVRIWQVLVRAALPQQAVPFRAVLGPYLGSVAASVLAPLRGGDAVRIALARRTLPEARSVAVLSTLAAEAIAGLVVVPLLCAAALLLGVLPVSPGLAGLALAGGALVALATWSVVRLVTRRRRDGRLGRVLADLSSGLRLVGSPVRFARTVGPLTALDWALRLVMIWCLLGGLPPRLRRCGPRWCRCDRLPHDAASDPPERRRGATGGNRRWPARPRVGNVPCRLLGRSADPRRCGECAGRSRRVGAPSSAAARAARAFPGRTRLGVEFGPSGSGVALRTGHDEV